MIGKIRKLKANRIQLKRHPSVICTNA